MAQRKVVAGKAGEFSSFLAFVNVFQEFDN